MVSKESGWATRQQVADHVQKSVDSIDRLIRSGQLPASKIGRSVRIKWTDVKKLAKPITAGYEHADNVVSDPFAGGGRYE